MNIGAYHNKRCRPANLLQPCLFESPVHLFDPTQSLILSYDAINNLIMKTKTRKKISTSGVMQGEFLLFQV